MAKVKQDFIQLVGELEKFSQMEGSEWGETAARLCAMWYSRCLLSDAFIKALEKEIAAWLKDVKENAHIEESEETRSFRTVDLVWDN